MKTQKVKIHHLHQPAQQRFIAAAAVEALFRACPDQELLLTAELVFHHFIRPLELCDLDQQQILRNASGHPVGLQVDGTFARRLALDPSRGTLLRLMSPADGRVFTHRDPFRRLQRFAQTLGIHISRRSVLCTVVMQAHAAGILSAEIAQKLGLRNARQHRHIFNPIPHGQAHQYWNVTVAVEHACRLPRCVTLTTHRNDQ